MEKKENFIGINCLLAFCSAFLLVITIKHLPVPDSVYPWLKFASMILVAFILALFYDNGKGIVDNILFFTSFACISTTMQIAIWTLCGEYICYGYIDVMWLTPAWMGIIFFACRRGCESFGAFTFKSLILGSIFVIPFAILKVLGGLAKLF